jgi:hypothetical protein
MNAAMWGMKGILTNQSADVERERKWRKKGLLATIQ